ncbi:RNA methyltransferase substrate-binding domain-containing protein [Mesorhizobium sp. M2A.F.Ca.ET.043.02.1.1]|uniref:TrmH family RNA methyltransferase n=1 Tax=Mesorhizobium sp. M2A.F.Ca.ET.043.02.1.1 TaxID=2493670 RepID=UPI0032B26788
MNDDKSTKPGTRKDTHYAKLRRAHRDQKAGGAPAFRPRQPVPPGEGPGDGLVRLYGLHTVRAALDNPRRKIKRMLVTRNAAERLSIGELAALPFKAELVEPKDIDRITGSDAVHQGVLIEAEPLKPKRLDALGDTRLVLVLDQVTDPHNVGAILRSAVASAPRLITTARHSRRSGVTIPRPAAAIGAGDPQRGGAAFDRRACRPAFQGRVGRAEGHRQDHRVGRRASGRADRGRAAASPPAPCGRPRRAAPARPPLHATARRNPAFWRNPRPGPWSISTRSR